MIDVYDDVKDANVRLSLLMSFAQSQKDYATIGLTLHPSQWPVARAQRRSAADALWSARRLARANGWRIEPLRRAGFDRNRRPLRPGQLFI